MKATQEHHNCARILIMRFEGIDKSSLTAMAAIGRKQTVMSPRIKPFEWLLLVRADAGAAGEQSVNWKKTSVVASLPSGVLSDGAASVARPLG